MTLIVTQTHCNIFEVAPGDLHQEESVLVVYVTDVELSRPVHHQLAVANNVLGSTCSSPVLQSSSDMLQSCLCH